MTTDPTFIQALYFLGILIGTLFISISAFYRKMKAGVFDEWSDFASEYAILMLFSIIASVVATFLLGAINPITVTDPFQVMTAGLIVGMGSKQTLEEIWKHIDPDWWP